MKLTDLTSIPVPMIAVAIAALLVIALLWRLLTRRHRHAPQALALNTHPLDAEHLFMLQALQQAVPDTLLVLADIPVGRVVEADQRSAVQRHTASDMESTLFDFLLIEKDSGKVRAAVEYQDQDSNPAQLSWLEELCHMVDLPLLTLIKGVNDSPRGLKDKLNEVLQRQRFQLKPDDVPQDDVLASLAQLERNKPDNDPLAGLSASREAESAPVPERRAAMPQQPVRAAATPVAPREPTFSEARHFAPVPASRFKTPPPDDIEWDERNTNPEVPILEQMAEPPVPQAAQIPRHRLPLDELQLNPLAPASMADTATRITTTRMEVPVAPAPTRPVQQPVSPRINAPRRSTNAINDLIDDDDPPISL
ncbi:DUF2726 domain-containing protein [Pokkaliibacter sp. MBI-7]|uniref:DUF2726 domain-containing protein n=1 Tax=Pokkaliibacter sp. MBI-7 TaxID=3040600 RepID=UPI002447B799|nr:DUF2726 domain-containing protein [Pokkaliibacter sp. MBI-7]MDH2435137.1 DUF2726 domain-containing protein [Pokkaliibacter sp. MBI-7]